MEVGVADVVLADIRQKLENSPGFNRQSWEQAANYSLNNGGDLEEALGWIKICDTWKSLLAQHYKILLKLLV